jgi:hypothetical protein
MASTLAESRPSDLEAQHDNIQESDYHDELQKIKSAGAITISPELFEKVSPRLM